MVNIQILYLLKFLKLILNKMIDDAKLNCNVLKLARKYIGMVK
jgi:hypothetical protein